MIVHSEYKSTKANEVMLGRTTYRGYTIAYSTSKGDARWNIYNGPWDKSDYVTYAPSFTEAKGYIDSWLTAP